MARTLWPGELMDINVLAYRLVQGATEPSSPEAARKKADSRKGGIAGGQARANSLSETQRKQIALAGSAARWSHKNPVVGSREETR
jgi:hypothetical protein